MEHAVIKVSGMTCGGCVASVTRILEGQPGVREVRVSLKEGEAAVDFEPAQISRQALCVAVEAAGYEAH
jgi:copper chaperone